MINNEKFNLMCEYGLYYAKKLNIDTNIETITSILKSSYGYYKTSSDIEDSIEVYFSDILKEYKKEDDTYYEEEYTLEKVLKDLLNKNKM